MNETAGTLPRLAGPRVLLVPATLPVAEAVRDGDPGRLADALASAQLRACPDWPHDQTPALLTRLTVEPSPTDLATWLVTHAGEVVGECGWRADPGDPGAVELGYGLSPAARGQGLATEAVALLAAWAERRPGITLLVAEVRVGNEPSRRLLRRLGFTPDGIGGAGDPHLRLVRPAATADRPRGRHVC